MRRSQNLKKISQFFWHLLRSFKTIGRFFYHFCGLFRKPSFAWDPFCLYSFIFENPTSNSNLRRYLSSKLADLCKNIINLTSLNTLPRCKKQKVWLWHFRLAHRSKTRFGKRDEMRICFDDKLTIFSNPVKVGHSGIKYLLNMHWQFSNHSFPIFQP